MTKIEKYILWLLALVTTLGVAMATHNTDGAGVVTLSKNDTSAGHFAMPPEGSTFVIKPCGPTIERADGIHYVTKGLGSGGTIAGVPAMTLTYTIAGDGVVVPTEGTNPRLALYFQRKGDDWSASGKYAAYRWYSRVRSELTPGTHTISIPLTRDQWTPVVSSTYNTDANFEAAKASPRRIGFVFGGSVGAGHGVCTTSGTATFTLVDFNP